ncbi:hypothetical protein HKCCE4037_00675 [Rhodobacterales bacterium HKCCE4037]|nr:hypothetical protein [Rhodobacterales bacterium HKCCE4037]
MYDALIQNATGIGMAINALMLLIWLVYLQLFLFTVQDQKRPALHIDRGAAKDESARLTVTNIGREAVYLVAIVMDFGNRDGTSRAVVTDRSETRPEDVSHHMDRTNQGPLREGEIRDIGSLGNLLDRARRRLTVPVDIGSVDQVWISAVAISHNGRRLVAASKAFTLDHYDAETTLLTPDTVFTTQVRSPLKRRKLLAWLEDRDEV